MKWPKTLKLFQKKRSQLEASSESKDDDDTGDLVPPPEASDDELSSKPKRRSVSIDISSRRSSERRTSLDLWHEARRARNSIEVQSRMVTTDKLIVCKAGYTTIVNKTYITIKHLGSGTFGKVMLCLNVSDQKLYAVKACRKSQFHQGLPRHGVGSRGSRRGLHNGFVGTTTSPPGVPMCLVPSCQPQVGIAGRCSPVPLCSGPQNPPRFAASGFVSPGLIGLGACATSLSSRDSGSLRSASSSTSSSTLHQDAMSRLRTEEMVKEIAILKKLSHPNVVNLVEVIDDPTTDSLLLVMEYIEGKTLEPRRITAERWEPVPEKTVWTYVREVLQGLDYLHYNKVVHGDMKPANLLLDSNTGKVKIVDFGSSIMTGKDLAPQLPLARGCTAFSTPAFRAPESLTSGYQLSHEMDMWALGVCVYMWIFGMLPFNGASPYIVYEKIKCEEVALPDMTMCSPELADFLMGLLDKSSAKRLDVARAMQHPWVTRYGTVPMISVEAQDELMEDVFERPGMVSVTQEDINSAIRESPGEAGLSELDNVFKEVHFVDGERCISAGDSAERIYLIARGEVEIYRDVGYLDSNNAPIISNVSLDHIGELEPSDFLDMTAPTLELGSSPPGGEVPRMGGKRILAVKGPGECLGLGCMHPGRDQDHIWKASVRARGPVTMFIARMEDVLSLIARHPEVEPAVQQIVTQQKTDIMVAEAMRQLRLYSSPLNGGPGISGVLQSMVAASS